MQIYLVYNENDYHKTKPLNIRDQSKIHMKKGKTFIRDNVTYKIIDVITGPMMAEDDKVAYVIKVD